MITTSNRRSLQISAKKEVRKMKSCKKMTADKMVKFIIPRIYETYIPLSFYYYLFICITGVGNALYGYLIDIVRIIVILLYAHFIRISYNPDERSDGKSVNPSKGFIIFAGLCLLEFAFTVSLHGKMNPGYAIIPIVYLALFSLEVFSEAIAFKHLLKGDDRYCIVGWNMMNFCIIGTIIIDFLDAGLPRDMSSVLFFLTIELFRESFRTFSIRNCIAVDCKESSNE